MAADESSSAWYLHSLGRRFGPLSEDELRGYFRAGMVKSSDRIGVPNSAELLPASEVAAMLGESAPAGPPPAPLEPIATSIAATPAAPAVRAVITRTPEEQAAIEERAAKAMAAMNIDFAAMAASAKSRTSSGWLLPVVAGVSLIALLFIALNMMRKLGPKEGPAPFSSETIEPLGTRNAPDGIADASSVAPVSSQPRDFIPPTPVGSDPGQAWFQRADQLSTLRDWDGLQQHAQKWTQAEPNRVDAWQSLGLAHARLGQVDQAASAFERVFQADANNVKARTMMAEAYLAATRWPEAVAAYQKLVATSPGDARLWNNYGVALRQSNQAVQAAAALETAVRLDPGLREGWNNLGEVYKGLGDDARAAAAFAQANGLR